MSDNDKERSQKVYQWARLQLNKRVGAGECWHFADRALRQAGARSSATTGVEDNYDWGAPAGPSHQLLDHFDQLEGGTKNELVWAVDMVGGTPASTIA